jgi:ferredoxin like protein
VNIEAKLGLNVFKIAAESHIAINHEICRAKCQMRPCLHVCPANVYTLVYTLVYTRDQGGQVQAAHEGCLECGTCVIACPHEALTWHYPNAGFGVQYRFG